MDVFISRHYWSNMHWRISFSLTRCKACNERLSHIPTKVNMRILLFCYPCCFQFIQYVCIHKGSIHKKLQEVCPCFLQKAAKSILHSHLIMPINTTHVLVVQADILWLINVNHLASYPAISYNCLLGATVRAKHSHCCAPRPWQLSLYDQTASS